MKVPSPRVIKFRDAPCAGVLSCAVVRRMWRMQVYYEFRYQRSRSPNPCIPMVSTACFSHSSGVGFSLAHGISLHCAFFPNQGRSTLGIEPDGLRAVASRFPGHHGAVLMPPFCNGAVIFAIQLMTGTHLRKEHNQDHCTHYG